MSPQPTYRIEAELGRGALGRVVRVREVDTGQVWAGKILHHSHRDDARALARFEGEARLLADLAHDNLVRVRGIEAIDGERVLLMELVGGPSLAELIARDAPLPADRVAAIGRQLAAGLTAAHRAGLIHRDLKPANVLLADDGTPKLVDFGMARAASFAGVEAHAFTVVGTPDYMAPEATDPLAVDARSDVYALGCILYELATGAPPFSGATAFAVLEAHRDAPIPELTDQPRELARVVRWCLAKSPADRPQSAAAVERALADVAGGALARVPERSAARATCAACGAARVPEVAVCFECGRAQAALEAGDHTVFITGPGPVTHRLDADRRDRLLSWLQANPSLGLDVSRLEKKFPRLPFALVTSVSEASGRSLAASVEALGFDCEVRRGGPLALPANRKKARTMSGRAALAGAGSTGWMWFQFSQLGAFLIPLFAVIATIPIVTGVRIARETVTRRTGTDGAPLPRTLAEALERVAGVVPAIAEARHRDSLRGVVDRALALRASLSAVELERVEAELANLVDLATVATSRMDEIDQRLATADLRDPSDELREQMRERDAWAARLLEVTGLLDALRARRTAASPRAEDDDALDELRAHIEALEEVRAL